MRPPPLRLLLLALLVVVAACGRPDDRYDDEPTDAYEESYDDAYDDGATGGGSGATNLVCVYQGGSRTACPGFNDSTGTAWHCSASYTTVEACRAGFESDVDCDGECCFDSWYSSHQIVEGPCDAALAAIEGGGSGGGSSGGAEEPDCSACVDVCQQGGYAGWSGTCDASTCFCNDCTTCASLCEEDGYAGFSGVCDDQTCYCSGE